MKLVIIAAFAIVAVVGEKPVYSNANTRDAAPVPVAILINERAHEEDGSFSAHFVADNGIEFTQQGQPEGEEGAVVISGSYKYIAPDGQEIEVTYVADETGYKPESSVLPVAPAFPHEIPEFVLAQIRKAAEEDAAAAREAAASQKSATYSAPPPPPTPSDIYAHPQ